MTIHTLMGMVFSCQNGTRKIVETAPQYCIYS
ncbi:conserved hypothetical protein, partial [delta proteobacterium NaphS2]